MTYSQSYRLAKDSSSRYKSPMFVPLLADTGVPIEWTSLPQQEEKETKPQLSVDSMYSLARFTTLLGFVIGIIAPFITIDITLLIAYGCARLDVGLPEKKELFVILDVLWGVIVILMAVTAPCLLRGTIFRYFGVKEMPQKLQELVEVRMALGTLVGVLVSEVGMCFFLDCGFWEYAGLAFGGGVVLSYCKSRYFRLNLEDCGAVETNTPPVRGMLVV